MLFVIYLAWMSPTYCNSRQNVFDAYTDMSTFLKKQSTALAEYEEQLIRRLIEKVTVYEDKFIVEFKSGLTVDVNE
jgi:site-specific DNA recombinase